MAAIVIITIYLEGYFLSAVLISYSKRPHDEMEGFMMLMWPLVLIVGIIGGLFILLAKQGKSLGNGLRRNKRS